jgi:hypothetical protein
VNTENKGDLPVQSLRFNAAISDGRLRTIMSDAEIVTINRGSSQCFVEFLSRGGLASRSHFGTGVPVIIEIRIMMMTATMLSIMDNPIRDAKKTETARMPPSKPLERKR